MGENSAGHPDETVMGNPTMTLIDLFVFGLTVLFSLNGFRSGALRSLFSLLWVYIVLVITALFYGKAATLLQATSNTSSPVAQVICFSIIFIILFAITQIINFLLMRLLRLVEPKGISSRIIGTIFGTVEGILIISIVIMNIAFFPVKPPLKDMVFYKTMKNIAPGVVDVTIGHIPYLKDSVDLPKPEGSQKMNE